MAGKWLFGRLAQLSQTKLKLTHVTLYNNTNLMDFDQLESFLKLPGTQLSAGRRNVFAPNPPSLLRFAPWKKRLALNCLTAAEVSCPHRRRQGLPDDTRNRLWITQGHAGKLAEMERVPRGEIVVGANEGTCLHILPEVFAEFKKLYPVWAMQISRLERAKIMESIIDNSVDFGVVSAPVDDKRLTV